MIRAKVDAYLNLLFPELKIRGTKWFYAWKFQRNKKFVKNSIIALIVGAIVHILHMIWIDPGFSLNWAKYRISMASVAIIGALLTYFLRKQTEFLVKAPFVIISILFSYYQAKTCTWFSEVPYFYAFFIVCICGVVLQFGSGLVSIWIVGVFILQVKLLILAGFKYQLLLSAELVSLATGLILQSRISSEIDLFLVEQKEAETQKKLIETELELSAQIKAFLPTEIHRRLLSAVHVKKLGVAEAVKQAIAQRQAKVACLMTDIRGYTKQTNLSDNYLLSSAIPNIKTCTEIIDDLGGVSRLIGDMIFAYFEEEDPRDSLKRALIASCKLVQESDYLNSQLDEENRIIRYPLISFGDGLVGNIGAENSSREITVLGVPANILSRIDEVTKTDNFKKSFKPGTIVLTEEAMEFSNNNNLLSEISILELANYNFKIRDFPSEDRLGFIGNVSKAMLELDGNVLKREAA